MSLAHLIPITRFRDFTAEPFPPSSSVVIWVQNFCLPLCSKAVWKESGLQGQGGEVEGRRRRACQLLLNKLETVEKGDFYHNVIAFTAGMSLKGIFKSTFLLHIYVKNLVCPVSTIKWGGWQGTFWKQEVTSALKTSDCLPHRASKRTRQWPHRDCIQSLFDDGPFPHSLLSPRRKHTSPHPWIIWLNTISQMACFLQIRDTEFSQIEMWLLFLVPASRRKKTKN